MKKTEVNFKNILAYFVGNMRYKLYYSKFRFLIRTHIQAQIEFRVKFMDKVCYENGECVICGCRTTALQMANKACEKPCYPRMMGKEQWRMFFDYSGLVFCPDSQRFWRYYPKEGIANKEGRNYLTHYNSNFEEKIYEMD